MYEPHFTFQGFRYVAVEGWPGEPTLDALTGVVVHSDMPATGQFTTSNPLLNQLQHNIVWGQKGNFLDVPTDCPQRDERLGWTGDAQVFSRTAAFNMDVAGFFTKWLGDVAADQNAKGSVPYVVPDVLTEARQVRGRLGGLGRRRRDHPLDDVPELRRHAPPRAAVPQHEGVGRVHAARGDDEHLWNNRLPLRRLARLRHDRADYPGATTGKDLIATAFYAHSTDLLQRAAAVLGKKERRPSTRPPAEDQGGVPAGVRDGLGPRRREHADGLRPRAPVRPAARGAARGGGAPPRRRREPRGHLTTGFVGTPYLCHVLSRYGHTTSPTGC